MVIEPTLADWLIWGLNWSNLKKNIGKIDSIWLDQKTKLTQEKTWVENLLTFLKIKFGKNKIALIIIIFLKKIFMKFTFQ